MFEMNAAATWIFRFFFFVVMVNSAWLQAADRPNVLLLLADDLGINDISRNNHGDLVQTPHIDRLANQGQYFSRFYTDATCSPSRAALLTGQHPSRLGFSPVGWGIAPSLKTLPEVLVENGYTTHHVGKWHLGEGHPLSMPEKQGFQTSFGFVDQWKLKGPGKDGKWSNRPPTYYDPWLRTETGSAQQYQGHLENILADETVRLINKHKNTDKPWFIYHAFFAPHEPLQPEKSWQQEFEKSGKGKYQALVKQLDDNTGRIIQALKKTGQLEHTIVFFVSDNGATERFYPSNFPHYGRKGDYQGGAIIAPMMLYFPSQLKASVIDKPVAIHDIYPSLLAMLGIESPETDGIDFTGLQQRDFLVWEKHDGFSLQDFENQTRYMGTVLFNKLSDAIFSSDLVFYPPSIKDRSFLMPVLKSYLQQVYREWKLRSNRADLVTRKDSGRVEVSGDEFRRSIGGRQHSMMFALKQNPVKSTSLVSQQGLYQLSVDENNVFTFQLGNHRLQLPAKKAACQPVLVNTRLVDNANSIHKKLKSSIELRVGDKKQRIEFYFEGGVIDVTQPTILGSGVEDFAIYSTVMEFGHPVMGETFRSAFKRLCD